LKQQKANKQTKYKTKQKVKNQRIVWFEFLLSSSKYPTASVIRRSPESPSRKNRRTEQEHSTNISYKPTKIENHRKNKNETERETFNKSLQITISTRKRRRKKMEN